MLRRDFLKLVSVLPFIGAAKAVAAKAQLMTDAEISVKLWLRSVEARQGVSSVVPQSPCKGGICKATGGYYDEVCWSGNGAHCTTRDDPGQGESGWEFVHYPTPDMAWLQWKEAFRSYIEHRHGMIHWFILPGLHSMTEEMYAEDCRDTLSKGGWISGPKPHLPTHIVYSRVFVERDA